MANRLTPLVVAISLIAMGCLADESSSGDAQTTGGPVASGDPTMAGIPTDQLVRTADPYARGYTDQDFPRVQELAPGVFSYEQLRAAGNEKFTTVSLFVVSDEGILVADGQGSIEETRRMIARIAEISDAPITKVVVDSDHGDHTAGNSAFPQGVDFYAHPWSAGILNTAATGTSDGLAWARRLQVVEDRETLYMGGREIQILFLGRAHTGGDLVVYLPAEKIMFMSEAYLHRVFPAMRTAYPSEWVDMIEAAQAMDVDVYVPGHGFVDRPSILDSELQLFQDAIELVIAEATAHYEAGLDLATAQERARFGDLETWSLRSSQGPRAVQQVYAELNGELPGGTP
jgi:glyoxylase-like metal-dependent hydrolase (beta-lactamase superfamily II)